MLTDDDVWKRLATLLVLALLTLLPGTGRADACGSETPCRVENGFYFAAPPPAWNGTAPVGVFVFLHAHRATALEMMQYRELVETVHDLGFLFVAPQGSGESWSHRGVRRNLRDENAFLVAVLDDVERRFPVDRKRVVGSGFSQGASTLWYFACDVPGRFSAFVTLAGSFWLPVPDACSAGPVDLLHVHGTADRVMPLGGRLFRENFGQAPVKDGFDRLLALDRCNAEPDAIEDVGELSCRSWNSCASGSKLRFCTHSGDHHTNPVWLKSNRAWLESVLSRR